jgi:integrase
MPNNKWRAEVTLGWEKREGKPDKRIVKTKSGFKKKGDAVAYLEKLRDAAIGINQAITFKGMYDLWSTIHFNNITKDTEYCYTSAFSHCATLHYKRFCELKSQDLQSVVDGCKLGRRTKKNMKVLMTSMYRHAIENDYINKNYAEFIKLPPKEDSKKEAFTKSERDSLWELYENGHEFTEYILVMIYTGMRYGEISTVLKNNIYLKERYMIGGIKTENGKNRIIPICDMIFPIVKKIYGTSSEKLLDMPEKVFYNRFSDALDRAKVRPLKPHACRHTCATALAEAGVAPAIIQAILGHADYSTTMQYTHVQNLKNLLEGINKIDKVVAGSSSRSSSKTVDTKRQQKTETQKR